MSLLVIAAALAGAAPVCSAEHAAMGHCSLSEPAPAEHANSGHTGHAGEAADPPQAAPSDAAFTGPAHAADTLFDPAEMARAREQLRREHGAITTSMLLVDMLEARLHDGRDSYAWEVQAFSGGDIDRLRVKTEGEGSFGKDPEKAELQALWSHALDPWFNLHAGLRYDLRSGRAGRAHLVIGAQGLARYWFEVDGSLFLSDRGDISARAEASYDQRITQRLILQPRAEARLTLRNAGKGASRYEPSSVEAGLRLRYEIVREFAPYIGAAYEHAFGRPGSDESANGWSFVSGVRIWF